MRSRAPNEVPLTDVQQEEDKAKMLLGAKLLVSGFILILLVLDKNTWNHMTVYKLLVFDRSTWNQIGRIPVAKVLDCSLNVWTQVWTLTALLD